MFNSKKWFINSISKLFRCYDGPTTKFTHFWLVQLESWKFWLNFFGVFGIWHLGEWPCFICLISSALFCFCLWFFKFFSKGCVHDSFPDGHQSLLKGLNKCNIGCTNIYNLKLIIGLTEPEVLKTTDVKVDRWLRLSKYFISSCPNCQAAFSLWTVECFGGRLTASISAPIIRIIHQNIFLILNVEREKQGKPVTLQANGEST